MMRAPLGRVCREGEGGDVEGRGGDVVGGAVVGGTRRIWDSTRLSPLDGRTDGG